MDFSLLHPKLVHFPLALAVLVPLFASGIAVAWWRKKLSRQVWWIALAMQSLLVISGFAAMQAGESAEHRVESVVAENIIEEHAEGAELFVWVATAATIPFFLAAFIKKESLALVLSGAAVVGSCVVLALAIRAGGSGGALVYEHGAANAYMGANAGASGPATEAAGDADDDD